MSNFRPLLLQRRTAAAPGRLFTGHEGVVIHPHGRFWLTAGYPFVGACPLYFLLFLLLFSPPACFFSTVVIREDRRALSCISLRLGVVWASVRTVYTLSLTPPSLPPPKPGDVLLSWGCVMPKVFSPA